ncbi:MAG: ABC transporter ATP-binding protein [Bacteriovorax sp.]|nr:ABC transporter ATP-binding protein [Bacteriovorax sp.]
MIEFQNLTVGFNNKSVLTDLSGSIKPGELIALMGINGVGKSCFLKTVTGLNSPISGDLKIDNKSFKDFTPLEMAKNLAVVLTDKIQVDFLKVEELISLGRSPHTNFWGDLEENDNQALTDVIKLLKIDSIYDRFFSDLSDGQKQKVLLARALVQGPRYLFLDEPTTYLDIPSKIELMNILKIVSHEKKVGVLFSTHDLDLVKNIVDYIWLVDSEGVLHKKIPDEMAWSGLLAKNFNI